jgi:hypothetical protein
VCGRRRGTKSARLIKKGGKEKKERTCDGRREEDRNTRQANKGYKSIQTTQQGGKRE